MKNVVTFLCVFILSFSKIGFAQPESKWSYDIGISFFKSSVNNQPDELLYNPVFEKWAFIDNHPDQFDVSEYKALAPFSFILSAGADAFFRYKRYLMIKVGYVYTNTLGIGGKGNITYTDIPSGTLVSESKTISYSSHQLNYFIGPTLPVTKQGGEIYMGFSIMSPTFVNYREKYTRTEDSVVVMDYNKTFKGFFGNCRTVIGIQIPLAKRFKFGSELVFAYFNGIGLKSGTISEEGFKFPLMQWNFTFRYRIR